MDRESVAKESVALDVGVVLSLCRRDDQFGLMERMSDLVKSDRMNDRKNVKKSNIVQGKGGNNRERIETRRTGVERKTFIEWRRSNK